MAEQELRAVAGTGTFPTLKPTTGDAQTHPPANAEAEAEPGTDVPVPAKDDLKKLAAKLNLVSESIGRDLRFEVDMESGRSVIQVLDRETGEIIRQIPPEKANLTLTKNGFVELRLYDGNA